MVFGPLFIISINFDIHDPGFRTTRGNPFKRITTKTNIHTYVNIYKYIYTYVYTYIYKCVTYIMLLYCYIIYI
jgi:hypothetical protein